MPSPRKDFGAAKHLSAAANSALSIKYLSTSRLRPDPKNPRLHSEKQVQQIARSIEAFGFNVPLLVNAEMQVVAGHGRLQACQVLGITEAPTISLEHLTEAQARAFMIADNRLTENAAWDDRLLAEQLKELSDLDLDFSLETTGFEMGEIDLLIEGLSPALPARRILPMCFQTSSLEFRSQNLATCGCWASTGFTAAIR